MNDIASDLLIAKCYEEYGRYVLINRAIPFIDGLKPSQKRILIGVNEVAPYSTNHKMIKTVTAGSHVIGKYHPHGDASIHEAVARMARLGLIEGQGNFGAELMEKLDASAPRYTEVMSKQVFTSLLNRFAPYAPHFENALGNLEPTYIPTPIPIAFITGLTGIAVGATVRIPAFTPESIIQAWEANDPSLLKSFYGYKIIGGDLKELWTTGKGALELQFEVRASGSSEDRAGIVIEGRGEEFKPAMGNLDKLVDSNQIYIRDETTDIIRLVIARVPGSKQVSDDHVMNTVKKASLKRMGYNIRVYENKKVYRIGMKNWLDLSMAIFNNAIQKEKQDKINDINNKIDELTHLPQVAQRLIAGDDSKTIASTLSLDIDLVKKIEQYSLSNLRKSNHQEAINKLTKQISVIQKETVLANTLEEFKKIKPRPIV